MNIAFNYILSFRSLFNSEPRFPLPFDLLTCFKWWWIRNVQYSEMMQLMSFTLWLLEQFKSYDSRNSWWRNVLINIVRGLYWGRPFFVECWKCISKLQHNLDTDSLTLIIQPSLYSFNWTNSWQAKDVDVMHKLKHSAQDLVCMSLLTNDPDI